MRDSTVGQKVTMAANPEDSKERVVRLAREVKEHLPREDQLSLNSHRVGFIIAGEPEPEMMTGPLSEVLPGEAYAGIGVECDSEGDLYVRIRLTTYNLDRFSDDAVKYLIAHEFAHVVLGHVLFGFYAEGDRSPYSKGQLQTCYSVCEELADFYAVELYGCRAGAIEVAREVGASSHYHLCLLEEEVQAETDDPFGVSDQMQGAR